MLENIFSISLSISAIIALLLIISPLLKRHYTAKWRYFVWLILAIRLIIPFRIDLPQEPIQIRVPVQNVTIHSQIITPTPMVNLNHKKIANNSASSSASIPVPAAGMKDVLVIVWAIGASSFFVYYIVGYLRFTRKIRIWCISTKIQSNPEVMICKKISSPMLIGFFNTVILLPNSDYKDNELSAILSHEQAHYKRGDLWYKLILIVANSIHWFNPLVYIMVQLANRDLEFSCDDIVIENQDLAFRKNYSNAILNTAYHIGTTKLFTYFNGGKKNMKQRFKNIFDTETKNRGTLAIAMILAITVMAGSLVACSSASATALPEEVTFTDMPEGITCTIAEKEKYSKLEKLIIDEFDIPDEYLKETRYYYNYVDLNNDGNEEIFVVVMGIYTSGTGGSSAIIVNQNEDELNVSQSLSLIHTPVIISDKLTNGYKEIIVEYYGGGETQEERYVVLKNTDGSYNDVSDGTPLGSIDDIKGTAIICNDIEKEVEEGTALTLSK